MGNRLCFFKTQYFLITFEMERRLNKNDMFEEFQQTFSEEIVSTISDIAKEIHENLQALIMSTMQNAEKLEHSLNYHIRNMNKSLLDYLNLETIRNSDNDFRMNSRFKSSRYEDAVRDF